MKKILIPLLLCVLISGCAVYRSRHFVPTDYYRDYRNSPPVFKVDTFEDWDILINFSAYYGTVGLFPESSNLDRFGIDVTATTYEKNLSQYRDTKYRAHIKSLRILHGEKLQDEIIIPATESSIAKDGKFVLLGSAGATLHVPSHVKSVTVISEIEFIEKNGNSIVKKFIIPMNFKEETSIGPPLD